MARSALKSLTGVLIFLSLFSLFTPQMALSASDGDKITVEAEGIGATKMEALKSAWQEAVRSAVGMYMAGKTEVLNDNITEEIASYSRGQIDSFKILSESEDNGAWRIRIRANVDRDILKETIAPSQSQTVGVDGASLAAQLQGDIDKRKDASDVAKISDLFNFYNCLDYQAYPQRYNVGGKNYIIVQHVLRMNPNKFQQHAKELEKFLGQISISKKNMSLDSNAAKQALKISLEKNFSLELTPDEVKRVYQEHNYFVVANSDTIEANLGAGIGGRKFNDMCNAQFKFTSPMEFSALKNIGIVKNATTAIVYDVPSDSNEIFNKIKNYKLKFQVSTGDGFDAINEESPSVRISFAKRNSPLFSPAFYVGSYQYQIPALILLQSLDVTPEQLANVKGFTCRFTLDPINN